MYSVPLHGHLRSFLGEAQNLRSYQISRSPKYLLLFETKFLPDIGPRTVFLTQQHVVTVDDAPPYLPQRLCIKSPFSTNILSQCFTLQEEKMILITNENTGSTQVVSRTYLFTAFKHTLLLNSMQ